MIDMFMLNINQSSALSFELERIADGGGWGSHRGFQSDTELAQ